jgi:hypothetical protein
MTMETVWKPPAARQARPTTPICEQKSLHNETASWVPKGENFRFNLTYFDFVRKKV